MGECRSSTSGCFSSMTESTSPSQQLKQQHSKNPTESPYQLRLIDDTTSNDYADDDDNDNDNGNKEHEQNNYTHKDNVSRCLN
jgi:hypothetical protein